MAARKRNSCLNLTCQKNKDLIKQKKDLIKQVGTIDMDDWFQYFASLFFENKYDHSIRNFTEYNIYIEELDKKFTLQE